MGIMGSENTSLLVWFLKGTENTKDETDLFILKVKTEGNSDSGCYWPRDLYFVSVLLNFVWTGRAPSTGQSCVERCSEREICERGELR